MTTYKYKGLSPDGAKLSGVIKAYNEFEAVAQLRETCSVITKIEEVKETQSWNKQIGTKKIKDKELAIICSQFAIILTSGLPIVRCVEMVAAQARTKELQKMLKKVAEDVSGGYSLAQSFENNATGFPTTFIETVRAGEQSGTLEECFEKLHKYYDKTAKMKAKIISTLTYPAIVICVAVIVFIIIMVVAVPAYKRVSGARYRAAGHHKGAHRNVGFSHELLVVAYFDCARVLHRQASAEKERKRACVPCGKQAKALTAQKNAQSERRFAVCKHHEHHAHGGLADYKGAGGHGKCGR